MSKQVIPRVHNIATYQCLFALYIFFTFLPTFFFLLLHILSTFLPLFRILI